MSGIRGEDASHPREKPRMPAADAMSPRDCPSTMTSRSSPNHPSTLPACVNVVSRRRHSSAAASGREREFPVVSESSPSQVGPLDGKDSLPAR